MAQKQVVVFPDLPPISDWRNLSKLLKELGFYKMDGKRQNHPHYYRYLNDKAQPLPPPDTRRMWKRNRPSSVIVQFLGHSGSCSDRFGLANAYGDVKRLEKERLAILK